MLTWIKNDSTRAPRYLKYRTSTAFITITVSFAIFTDVFIYGLIVPVVPFALTERAGIPDSDIQFWTSVLLAIYGAALCITAPVCGWLADRSNSRRIPLLTGLLALAGSTVMLCVGRTISIIAAGRVLQGMSAAIVWVVGLAMLVDTVGNDAIGQTMGYVGLAVSSSVLSAPLLGGIVFERAGYYSVWAMAFGLIGLDVALRLVMVERKIAVRWDVRYQPKRAAIRHEAKDLEKTVTSPLKVRSYRTTNGSDELKDCTQQIPVPLLDLHARDENTSNKQHSRLPSIFKLLSSTRLLSALFAVMIQSALLTSFDSVLPLFAKTTFGWTAAGAGLIFLPFVVPSFTGPLIGRLSDKHGPRWYATAGFTGCCPFLILLRFVDHDSLSQKTLMCALLAFIGLFLTLALTPLMAEITYAVMDMESGRPRGYFGENGAYAQAYSLFNIAWAAGCMIGPLLAGMIVDSNGWPTATLILGCISLNTAVPVIIWTGGNLWKVSWTKAEKEAEMMSPVWNSKM
jgi:MFS family permease